MILGQDPSSIIIIEYWDNVEIVVIKETKELGGLYAGMIMTMFIIFTISLKEIIISILIVKKTLFHLK